MAVDVGSAVGYLDLDISGFLAGLKSAQSEADKQSKNIVTTIGNNISGVGKTLSSVGSTLTKTVTVPIVGAGTAVVTMSSNFESAMSKVSAISGATGNDLDKLNKKAQEMGAKTKFSATEAAEAFTYMAMAGWKTEDMLAGIDGIMNLAAADGLDLATTSDIVTDALTAFGLSASDSAHFADVLAKASSSANTNVSMLGESFKYVAPVAGALGYSAEDTAVALGLMANAGIKGSQSGTALRGALTKLIKPTDDGAFLMEKYGLSMTNANGSMKSLGEVMVMLRNNLGNLTEAEQAQVAATLFGQEAMSGMLAIINSSDKDFQNLTDQIYSADGAAQQMADTMLNNLKGQLTILKSSLEGLALQFGEILLPYLKQFVEWLQKLLQKFQQLSPEQKEQIVKWGAIAAAIGPVLLVLGKLVASVGSVITVFGKVPGAIGKLKTGVTGVVNGLKNVGEGFKLAKAGYSGLATTAGGAGTKIGAAMAGISASVLWVVAIIAVLVAAFVSLWKNNEEFRNKIIGIWNGIKDMFVDFGKKITEQIKSLGFNFENFGEVLRALWQGLCDFLAPLFIGVFQGLSDTIKFVLDTILATVKFFVAIFKGDWEGAWSAIKEFFVAHWTFIVDFFKNVGSMLTGILDAVCGWFGTTWEDTWKSIKEFFVNIWNGIVTWFQNTINGIATFFKNVWTGISTFFSNLWNGIVSFLKNAWETIKNVVQVGIMFIAELFKAAFQIITLPFRFIWENCKETIISIWEAIKTTITNVLNAISTFISNVWNSIKAFLEPILTSIKTFVSNVWNSIKNTITTVLNAIKSVITTIFNAIKDTITNIWNKIKTTVSNVVNSVKTTVTNVFNAIQTTATNIWNSIKSAITGPIESAKTIISNIVNNIKTIFTNGFNAAKNTVTSIFNSIKSTISNVIESAKNIVKTGIDKLKSFFNFEWSLPKLKLPHFSISGKFSLNPPSVPHFSVSWYKKAMGNGMILNSPTIFGFDPSTGKFLGGGEAGSETVVGTKNLMNMIRKAVNEAVGPLVATSRELAKASAELGYVTYNGFTKVKEFASNSGNSNSGNNGGGDTFVFNSPKPIDEIEAAKQMKKAKRELAEGF